MTVGANLREGGMVEENSFYMWTIVEAWDWLIDVLVLGFAFLILLGIFVLFWVAVIIDSFGSRS